MKKTVRIGSRESKLAVVQTEIVMDRIPGTAAGLGSGTGDHEDDRR